jgi:hypothetical protein
VTITPIMLFVAFVVVLAVTAKWCYELGVKDTEGRWREAVGRADDARTRAPR